MNNSDYLRILVAAVVLAVSLSIGLSLIQDIDKSSYIQETEHDKDNNTIYVFVNTTSGLSNGSTINITLSLVDEERRLYRNPATGSVYPHIVEDTFMEKRISRVVEPSSEYKYKIEYGDTEKEVDGYSVRIE
jgi:hypothetical protein